MTGRHHKHHVFLLIVALCISIVTSLSTTTAGTTIGTCIQDFQEIYDSEAFVLDTSVSRTYVICPNKLYEIGELDVNRGIRKKDDGSPPLPLRSNVHLLCGENGSRDNLCYITGGYLQVDGTAIGGISDDLMENVLVEGFVFVDAIMYSFWGMKSGHVTFRDCEWRDFKRTHGAPIILDYFDSNNEGRELVITFDNCRFSNNRYFGYGAQTSLIVGNSQHNKLVVRGTIFEDNDMTFNNTSPRSYTHLIESLGPVQVEKSCFVNNQVVGSNVAVYGNRFNSVQIHSVESAGQDCAFASVFETYQRLKSRTPLCVSATKPTCDLDIVEEIMVENLTLVNQYVPFAIGALEFDFATESDAIQQGACDKDEGVTARGPDAQNNVDEVCLQYGGCYISHTTAGEQVLYRFGHYENYETDGYVFVDITLRVSSVRPKLVKLDLFYEEDSDVEDSWIFETEGGGYDQYEDVTWTEVPLRGYESMHSLAVTFLDGGVNLCMVSASYSFEGEAPDILMQAMIRSNTPSKSIEEIDRILTIPGAYSALYFTNESPGNSANGFVGDCRSRPDSFVDAWTTGDLVCGEAINEYETNCYLGPTNPGEWIAYDFRKEPMNEIISVSIRISSAVTEPIEVSLFSNSSMTEPLESYRGVSPGLGSVRKRFSTYTVWHEINVGNHSNYRIKIGFPKGGVKLCAVAVF